MQLNSFISTSVPLSSCYEYINVIKQLLDTISLPFTTPKLYLNFLFWYSFCLYLLFIALTIPLNLGGCVTDYHTLRITLFHQCITCVLYMQYCRITYITLIYQSPLLSYCIPLPHVYIPLHFYSFTIKSFMQFLTLQKLIFRLVYNFLVRKSVIKEFKLLLLSCL